MDIQTAKEIIRAAAMSDDTVLLEGPHGVGKSDAAKQIQIEDGYHMETRFLSHQEVGDLIGSPHTIVNEDGNSITTWAVPIWLQRMSDAAKQGKKCLLCLDELNRAPLDVRQSAMQLVLERQIHEHILPTVNGQRTCVIAAINPADEYQVDELDPALLDRFLCATIEADAKVWLKWARENGVNQIVRDFISEHPDRIHWTPADGGVGATPRAWKKLGDYINNIDAVPEEIVFQIMKGKIGSDLGSQFYSFYKNYVDVVKVADIEEIVEENKDNFDKIEDLAELVTEKVQSQEAVQKTELAEQLLTKAIKSNDMFVLLTYLYAQDVEICVSFIKALRTDNIDAFKKLVELDNELNKKELFKRIVKAADKKD